MWQPFGVHGTYAKVLNPPGSLLQHCQDPLLVGQVLGAPSPGCHSTRISPSLSTLRASALAGLRLQVGVYFASVQKQSPGYGPGCTLKLYLFVCLCVCVRIRVTSSWRHCADVTAACNRRWANTRANMLRWPSVCLSVRLCPVVCGPVILTNSLRPCLGLWPVIQITVTSSCICMYKFAHYVVERWQTRWRDDHVQLFELFNISRNSARTHK